MTIFLLSRHEIVVEPFPFYRKVDAKRPLFHVLGFNLDISYLFFLLSQHSSLDFHPTL
ncbi:hypothetical protein [Staphylococcus phage PT94]